MNPDEVVPMIQLLVPDAAGIEPYTDDLDVPYVDDEDMVYTPP